MVCSWCSGSDEFADDVAAGEKANQLPLAHDRDALNVLVDHERRYLSDGLLGGDAQHLACHYVAHGALMLSAERRESWRGARVERRRHEMTHQLALAEES